jgi:serine/threonine-protein kinase
LHRDFKSDNVLLRSERDGSCTPVILDFGLARAMDETSTATGSHRALVGTIEYIAPEQVEGKPLSVASDVYSFGVSWYEMLTGELPFESTQSSRERSIDRMHEEPRPPSRLNRALPSELDAIVLRCLSRDPAMRFQSAADVLAALDALTTVPRERAWRRLAVLAVAAGAAFGLATQWLFN